jgi:hypothetical protein
LDDELAMNIAMRHSIQIREHEWLVANDMLQELTQPLAALTVIYAALQKHENTGIPNPYHWTKESHHLENLRKCAEELLALVQIKLGVPEG